MKEMKKIIACLLTLPILLIGGFFSNSVSAIEGGLPYVVEPLLPNNQDPDIQNYISISPESNSIEQELQFLLTNTTNEKQEIDIEIYNAYTSNNGGIQYRSEADENSQITDDRYEMKQYIHAPEKVELQGGETKIVNLKLDIPNAEGTILGAVAFRVDSNSEETESEGISFEIKNEINTVYGIAINFPTDKDYSFNIEDPFVSAMASYYTLRLPVDMSSPLMLKEVDIDYQVEYKGEKLFFDQTKIDFAPMTKTNFSIPFNYEEIVENEPYILKGTLTYQDINGKQQAIEFEEEFKYQVQEDNIFNTIVDKLTTPTEVSSNTGIVWILLLLGVSTFLVIFVVLKRKGKKDKAAEPGEKELAN